MIYEVAAGSSSGSGSTVVIFLVIFGAFALLWLRMASKPPTTPTWARYKPVNTVQLRKDANAKFVDAGIFPFGSRFWFLGTGCPPVRIKNDQHKRLAHLREQTPVKVVAGTTRSWWWFGENFYWESGNYAPMDVLALVRDQERRNQQRLQRAHTMLNAEHQVAGNRRRPIPRDLRRLVYERDGGQCVECGSTFDLQYDHIIPVALGGATSFENLQLLCGACNREKSANL